MGDTRDRPKIEIAMTDQTTRPPKRSIALIGLRGSGKTTVGRILGARLGAEAVDVDEIIEQESGQSIAEIFAQEGEAGFRQREREAIARTVAAPPAVISVGGGAILDKSNATALAQVATIVWLTAPSRVLWERLAKDPATPSSRPPLTDRDGMAELEELARERSPIYQRVADLVIDTTELSPKQVAEAISAKLPDAEDR